MINKVVSFLMLGILSKQWVRKKKNCTTRDNWIENNRIMNSLGFITDELVRLSGQMLLGKHYLERLYGKNTTSKEGSSS